MLLFIEQTLGGLQLGVFLFLVATGLTLIFGIMGVINLAHGSLYMVGAFAAAYGTQATGSFFLGLILALAVSAGAGLLLEVLIIRQLYSRNHLDQVLATFGVILFTNELVTIVFGRQPLFADTPAALSGSIEIVPGLNYPIYRLVIILTGILAACILYYVISRTRAGMLIRAGATNREMVSALGVDISLMFTLLFAFGAAFAGLAGAMTAPLVSVEVGMGEHLLILTFVVIVIGGIGSVKGAFAGALLVGLTDSLGRAFLPDLMKLLLPPAEASTLAGGLSSMMIYLLMAVVLIFKPTGLFPVRSGVH